MKELGHIPKTMIADIVKRLDSLAEQPRRQGVMKLAGVDGYRLRIGDYRVLFQIDDRARIVTVYRIGHRREVYR